MNLHPEEPEYARMKSVIMRNYNSSFNRRVTNINELAEDMGVLSEVQCRQVLLDISQVSEGEDEKYKIIYEIAFSIMYRIWIRGAGMRIMMFLTTSMHSLFKT